MECTSFRLPVPAGVYYGQFESQDTINNKLYERNLPTASLRPNMDARSVPTRNVLYPEYDQRTRNTKTYLDYSLDKTFAPVQSNAPPGGFQVNTESNLRNQYFALQHGAIQGVYVPSSESDLYKNSVPTSTGPSPPQPFTHLFSFPRATTEPPPLADKIGTEVFNNCTKTQLRNVTGMYSF
jgi:hypothetical protein